MNKRKVPEQTQRVINVSIKQDDVPYWETRVEPFVQRFYGGNRSAFIVDAVKDFIDRKNGVRRV